MTFAGAWSIYATATPFQYLHGVVLVWVLFELGRAWREGSYLLTWKPGDTSRPIGDALVAMAVRARRGGGASGEVVTSNVEDRIEWLQTLASFFLLIGIAGTFFGMLRLAQPLGVGRSLQQELQAGLHSALPVGFFGVFLTMFGQAATSHVGGRLRRASSRAIARAVPTGEVNSYERLEKTLKEASDAWRASVAPLTGVEAALSSSLTPLVTAIDQSLNTSNQSLKEALAKIEAVLTAMREDVGRLKEPIDKLAASAGHVDMAFGRLDGLVTDMERRIEERGRAMMALETAIAQAIGRIDASAEELHKFPGRLNEAMSTSFDDLSKNWNESVLARTKDLTDIMASLATKVEGAAEAASASISGAAGNLVNFSENAGERLSRGIKDGADLLGDRIEKGATNLQHSFQSQFPDAIREATHGIDVGLGRMREMTEGLQRLDALTQSVLNAMQQWSASGEAMRDVTARLQASADDMHAATRALAEAQRSYITIRLPKLSRKGRA